MDYGKILGRAWTILVGNKYLLVLGILASLTGGGSSSGSSYQPSDNGVEQFLDGSPVIEQFEAWMGMAAAAVIGLMCIAFVVFILLWALSQVARGSMIAGVDAIEEDGSSSLGESWRSGWQHKWTLIGIALVLFIPVLLLLVLFIGAGIAVFGAAMGGMAGLSEGLVAGGIVGIIAVVFAALCIFIPIMMFFGLWSEFAFRACMLEESGVWESFKRGWHVLLDNIGPVIILVLIRIGIGIALFLPTLMVSLCFLLWPLLLILQGAVTAYFSTVWTLAWREWTTQPPAQQPSEVLEVSQ